MNYKRGEETMKRDVRRHIAESKEILSRNLRYDFRASDFEQIKEMSQNNIWLAIMNACCFGFAVGYRFGRNEMGNSK